MTNVITQIENLFKNINGTNKTDIEEILKQNNTLDDPVQFDINRAIVLIPSFGILTIITIFANVFVCYVIAKNRHMHTVTNLFIANMAISDLLLAFINVPLNIARNLMNEWTLGSFLCHLFNYSLKVSVYVSTFTLTAIALDRQRVLLYPLHPRMTRKRGMFVLAFIWLLSICFSLPFGIYTNVKEINMITYKVKRCWSSYPSNKWEQYLTIATILFQYFIPLVVITCTYGRIVHKLWIRTHLGVVTENQRLMQIQAKRKSIKLLVAVVAVFAISWMPLNLYYILADHHPNTKVFHPDTNTFFVCHWIAISSSCINPFLYCWMNPAFSTVIAKRLQCLKSFTGGTEIEIDEIDSTGFRLRSNRRFGNSSRTISSFSASDSRRSSSKTFRGFAYMV
ncbi:GPR83 [Mytilus coruscus]|uniref:GPR83 n=1 Tax=Mytilus coruscus TaxID=42192 RepID=A0A6J8A4C5_MYTCO|nr:GPR83 [Mytilus coruscus]